MKWLLFFVVWGMLLFAVSSYMGASVGSAQENVNFQIQIITPTPTPTPAPGGGGGTVSTPPIPVPAAAELNGLAYPGALITILRDAQLVGTVRADASGVFLFLDSELAGGNYLYGLYAEDADGRQSRIITFSLNLVSQSLSNITGVIIPPTISVQPASVARGNPVIVSGFAMPGADIILEILPGGLTEIAPVGVTGRYSFSIETSILSAGIYQVRGKTQRADAGESVFSLSTGFGVDVPFIERAAEHVDFNRDERVNLVDISIMLFWFGKPVPANHFADLNEDGIIDVADFSILAFYWTG